jgi:predicted ribosomally synthesized peptide with nif11-like leader
MAEIGTWGEKYMSVAVGEMVKKIQADQGLRQALEGATDVESRVAAFRKAGLTVTAEDLTNAKSSMETGELSDADLERVAGGSTASWVMVTLQTLAAFG